LLKQGCGMPTSAGGPRELNLEPALHGGIQGQRGTGQGSAMEDQRQTLLREEGSPNGDEGLLLRRNSKRRTVPLNENRELVSYLQDNSGYHIVQHGCHHDYLEFDSPDRAELGRRLDYGAQRLRDAGFPRSQTFVAPYDRLSRASLNEVSRRFRVLSSGWYELRRLPYSWWPRYALKKLRRTPHWKVRRTMLLTHPGCLLSCFHEYSTMLDGIIRILETQQLTVLVTHWWEYFRKGEPDEEFIGFLHETANYLATHPRLKVISFDDLATGRYPIN